MFYDLTPILSHWRPTPTCPSHASLQRNPPPPLSSWTIPISYTLPASLSSSRRLSPLLSTMKLKGASNYETSKILVFFITTTFVILTFISLYSALQWQQAFPILNHTQTPSLSPPPADDDVEEDPIPQETNKLCDIFTGEWVPNPNGPYYTNRTCWAIHEHQNCMKYGRLDTDFMKWRWKPDGCDLPIFNPAQFLELVRDKSMAFVGDSVARNQMQSMICLLSRVSLQTLTRNILVYVPSYDYVGFFVIWHIFRANLILWNIMLKIN